jgi:hypothetical protein
MRHLRRLRTECASKELWTTEILFSTPDLGTINRIRDYPHMQVPTYEPKSLSHVTDTTYHDERHGMKDCLLKEEF